MNVLTRLRWGILACVTLGFLAYGVAESAPFAMLLLVVTGCTGWWVTEGRPMRHASSVARGRASQQSRRWPGLPRWVTNIALAFVILMAFLRGTKGDSVISAFAAFLAAICVLKLWEKREPTDYGQLLTMSLFLAIGATLNSNALGVGLVIAAMVPVIVLSAFSYQLYLAHTATSAQQSAPSSDEPSDTGAREQHMTSGVLALGLAQARRTRRALRIWGVITVACGFALATLVFIVTPRGLGDGQMGRLGRLSPLRQTGFANEVDLTSGGLISQSQAIVLTARFTDGKLQSYGSSNEAKYLRGAVLTEYRNGRWTSPDPGVTDMPQRRKTAGSVEPLAADGFVSPQILTITPKSPPAGNDPIFHVLRATKVSFLGDNDMHYDPRTGAMVRTLRRGPPSYDVHWSPRSSDANNDVRSDPPVPQFPQAFVMQEAARLLGEAGIPVSPGERDTGQTAIAARVFETYLRTNFEYSLDTPTPPSGADPVAWFLQTKPPGHCEFFAACLAALCRSVGIDARVIAGYMTNEFDDREGLYIVRASNAHAWVEVNTAPGVWRVFDGTPVASQAFQAQRRTTLLGMLSASLVGLDSLWNSRIVSFDDSIQRRVLGMESQSRAPWIVDVVQRLQRGPSLRLTAGKGSLRTLTLSAGVGLVLIGAGAIVWALLPKRARPGASGWAFKHTDASRMYGEVLSALHVLGVAKPDHVPLARHLDTLAATHDDPQVRHAAIQLAPLVQALYRQQFAGAAPLPARAARDVVRQVKSLRRHEPNNA